jgi:hypothetical protein
LVPIVNKEGEKQAKIQGDELKNKSENISLKEKL